jgi:hypothetical protein
MKLVILILSSLILAPLSSSLEFGISPDEIKLKGETSEQICTDFKLIGAENTLFEEGKVMWSEKETKQIKDYTFSSENKKIEVKYPENAFYGEKQICFTAKSSGKYYGAIFYKIHNSSYGIGTWITLEVEGSFILDKISYFTTNKSIVNNYERNSLLVIIFILLLIILFLIIRRTFRNLLSF